MEITIKGYKVQIDEEDYERVTSLKWWVQIAHGNVYFYHKFWNPEKTHKHNVSLQRFLLGLQPHDKRQGDHINGNTLDNRRSNLRICTIAENTRNMKRHKSNQTGFKGIQLNKKSGKYIARICVNLKQIHLGYFSTPEEAHTAYCEASKKYHGEYGRTE